MKLGIDEVFFKNRRYYSGILDDVLIYNRALNKGEVKALYEWGEKIKKGIKNPKKIE
ncbi:MAG: LamG domain-containing protein [Verrucomicrobia bacterium]|nr:LamG domain-containing protein [Verrucomicrobiota bacterium]